MSPCHQFTVIHDRAVCGRVLEKETYQLRIRELEGLRLPHMQRDAQRLRSRLHHRNGLRMAIVRHEKLFSFAAG